MTSGHLGANRRPGGVSTPNFISDITGDSPACQGDFAQASLVQETINAFEASIRAAGVG